MIGTYLKRLLPRTLYGRAAAILLLPMLTLQLAVTAVFVQRHFEDVTVQMTNNLLFEIKMVLDELKQPINFQCGGHHGAVVKIRIAQLGWRNK